MKTVIITLASAKGGTGKTTAALSLFAWFATLFESLRVALVDLDPEGYATTMGLGQQLVSDPLVAQPIEVGLGGARRAALFPAGDPIAHSNDDQIHAHLARAIRDSDVVIVDTPPTRTSPAVRSALRAATHIVTPVMPEVQSYAGFTRVLAERSAMGLTTPVHALFSRWDANTVVARSIHTRVLSKAPHRKLDAIVPRDQRVVESMVKAVPVPIGAPRSLAAHAYRLAAVELAAMANLGASEVEL